MTGSLISASDLFHDISDNYVFKLIIVYFIRYRTNKSIINIKFVNILCFIHSDKFNEIIDWLNRI